MALNIYIYIVYIRLGWKSCVEREEVLQFNRGFRMHPWVSALNSFQHFSKGYRHIVMHYSCWVGPLCAGWCGRKGWNEYEIYVFVAVTKRVASEKYAFGSGCLMLQCDVHTSANNHEYFKRSYDSFSHPQAFFLFQLLFSASPDFILFQLFLVILFIVSSPFIHSVSCCLLLSFPSSPFLSCRLETTHAVVQVCGSRYTKIQSWEDAIWVVPIQVSLMPSIRPKMLDQVSASRQAYAPDIRWKIIITYIY